MSKFLSILAAVALALALVVPVSAAETTLSLTVDSSGAMSGIPASINLGHSPGGDTLTADSFPVTVTSNTPGWSVTWAPSLLVLTGMESTALGSYSVVKVNNLAGAATPQAIPGGTVSPFNVTIAVDVPGDALAGAYTGSITWTLVLP